jgi:HK97 gp10 family phage protein
MAYKFFKFGDRKKAMSESLDNANIKLLMEITSQATNLTPVKTGILRNSISWKTDKASIGDLTTSVKAGQGIVGTRTEYAPHVEFGTKKMAAQPFLRPAIFLTIFGPKGFNILSKEVKKAMAKNITKSKKVKG